MNQGLTMTGASLKILKVGAKGIITGFSNTNDRVMRKLKSMDLRPGMSITLEQRFPRFIIAAGFQRFALDEALIHAIYVRPLDRHTR